MLEFVFDIETQADNVSSELEKEIFGRIEPTATAAKKGLDAVREYIESKQEEMRSDYALSPMTGKIVCICGLFGDKQVEFTGEEKHILKKFVNVANQCNKLVTFNGKSFDVPFIKVRMAKLGIPAIDLPTRKYDTDHHFDVYEVLTNFGANKKGNLRQWARFFGLTPPKDDGSEIAELSIEEIAVKCHKDVEVTKAIYDRIKTYY